MADITISQNYTCDPRNPHVPHNESLGVNPPPGGCTIFFAAPLNSSYSFTNGNHASISFSGQPVGTHIKFCICAPGSTCDPNAVSVKQDTGHTITIDPGTQP